MALKADDSDAVRVASEYMRQQQILVFNIGVVSISAMFLGACLLAWATYPTFVALIVSVVYLTGYYILIHQGAKAFEIFLPAVDVTIDERLQETAAKVSGLGFFSRYNSKTTSKPGGGGYMSPSSGSAGSVGSPGGAEDTMSEGGKSTMSGVSLLQSENPVDRIKLKAKGIVWKRKPLEKGGTFTKVFAVLEKGKLDFYNSEADYVNHENPLNTHPVKLWQHNVETDPRKFVRTVTSLRNTIKTALLGNEDFYVSDLMSAEYDLVYASKNYKFALIPKVSSELVASEITELLAHDEKAYKQWIRVLCTVCDAYDEIAASPSIEHTMRAGTSDVETVVQAANVVSTRFN